MIKMVRVAGILLYSAVISAQDAGTVYETISDDDYRSRYGHAEMNISCARTARSPFERGLLQLHSFAWESARESFKQATQADPQCAMAYWGVAMTYYDGLHEHPSAEEVESARAALASAWAAKTRSEREAGYISAAEHIFRGYPEVERVLRDQKYSEAMAELFQAYPDDHEAATFYSLSLLSLARRKANDHTLQMQAAGILEPLLAKLPDHPGVAHYLIHAYDDAGMRGPGIEAARRYAGIAPVLTHPQHMPAHIFAGLGMWKENNLSNAKALEADPAYYHALMYLVYGHLQLGQRRQAAELVENLRQFTLTPGASRASRRGLHSASTWLLLESRDWFAAAEAPAYSDAVVDMLDTLYVRGLGAARTGDVTRANMALDSLKDLLAQLEQQDDTDNKVRILLGQIQIRQVEALIQLAIGNNDAAIKTMREAIAIADRPGINRAQPDSGTGVPAHELFGEILMSTGQYVEAMLEFSASLQRTPNRLYSVIGLAQAAAAAGDQTVARAQYKAVLDLLAESDEPLAELTEAQTYLGDMTLNLSR